jgi:hypothetical protein
VHADKTGTPKFRGSGCQFPQSQCHPSPRTGIALGTRLVSRQLGQDAIDKQITSAKFEQFSERVKSTTMNLSKRTAMIVLLVITNCNERVAMISEKRGERLKY